MNDSKLTKMEDADKFKVIKALRAIKPISEGYEEFDQADTREAERR